MQFHISVYVIIQDFVKKKEKKYKYLIYYNLQRQVSLIKSVKKITIYQNIL